MNRMKSGVCVILAVMLIISVMALPVCASEAYSPNDTYVLDFNGTYTGAKWQYFSPYWPEFTYDGVVDDTTSLSFTLYNTVNDSVIPTYCTDLDVGLNSGSNFRRLNLEDSTYAASAAGKLRSIVNAGFPWVDVEALGAAAGVEALTVGEAVAATQAAIWQVAHGERAQFTDFCCFIDTEWNPTQTAYYEACMEEIDNGYAAAENEAKIEERISQVFDYLINLAPTAPSGVLVSNATFSSWTIPVVTANAPETEGGEATCDVTVDVTVDTAALTGTESLTISAVLGDYYVSQTMSADTASYTLTIQDVPANVAHGDVILAIDGYQTASDVYLFDAVGDRDASQSLIGKDDSRLPVHAEVIAQTERVLNFNKTERDTNNGLEGIIFDIYFICSLSDYLNGKVTLPEPAVKTYTADYTVVTGADGSATFNLTKNNADDGVYLIVERDHPAIVAPVAPFYVIVPATSPDGSSWVYSIDIAPKNQVKAEIDIEKDVIELGKDSGTVDAYENHTWIISATIPSDIASGKRYAISDTLDNRLDYVGNLKVQVETVEGDAVVATLAEGTDYILSLNDADSLTGEKDSDSFSVVLTSLGMKKVADAVNKNNDGHRIRVYFDAQINANANMDENIPNQATIEYTNSVGIEFDDESDIPEVHTGGLNVKKLSESVEGEVLSGAEFKLAEKAEGDEYDDIITVNGEKVKVNYVSFYPSDNFAGEKTDTAITNENGEAFLYGIAYGDYYLIETKAPAGYNKLTEAVEVKVDKGTQNADEVEGTWNIVINSQGVEMPSTGGMGTTILYIIGGVLVVAAVILLVTKKRMSNTK